MDVEAVERVEAELDAFISKRAREMAEANRTEEMWRASERRHRRKVRLANGQAWIDCFDHLALCHERRAAEYKDKSRGVAEMVSTLEGEAGGGGGGY